MSQAWGILSHYWSRDSRLDLNRECKLHCFRRRWMCVSLWKKDLAVCEWGWNRFSWSWVGTATVNRLIWDLAQANRWSGQQVNPAPMTTTTPYRQYLHTTLLSTHCPTRHIRCIPWQKNTQPIIWFSLLGIDSKFEDDEFVVAMVL